MCWGDADDGGFENVVASVVGGDGGAAHDHEVAGWGNWSRRQARAAREAAKVAPWLEARSGP